ncbi:hypothetical protein [Microvirga puerhi]|uniref:Uncharacterized protein n=1 Tax=Microvirga puerhi TaxID=2876078 RepID=A0ABS7VVF9_9HYPH|nr:hypothetical protein [Microvirga puerhi]MBZ6078897.1 hypothetical protein [Microvirga puerhi]
MGVDLKLLPLLSPGTWAAHDGIGLERRDEFWPKIEALEQAEIPEPLRCYHARTSDDAEGYGRLEKTPFGTRLTWTTAARLMTLASEHEVKDNWKNRAAWAYLAQMPPEHPIVLYWH